MNGGKRVSAPSRKCDKSKCFERQLTEKPYLNGGQRVDLYLKDGETAIPIEAKLLRFRYDNGNIDPNSFAKIFSSFPERTTSTLLTDARKLNEAGFVESGGLLGLY